MKRLALWVGSALLAALGLLVGYGVLVEPRLLLDKDRFTMALPQFPADAPGRTVAVFSDLQTGMWFSNTGMVEKAVEEVVMERPAAALIGGDFVYSRDPAPAEQMDLVVELLAPLTTAGIPTFAVLGNHDYAVDAADEVIAGLESIGIRVLRNEAVPIPGTESGGTELYVVGLGPARLDRTDVEAALAAVPDDAPRVVLMHNPTSFPRLPADSAPLAVAGHTHCGQVAIPFTPVWSYLELTSEERVVTDGWAPSGYGASGNRLYVNCGIGFSLVPMRIAAPPQVVFFDLRGAA
ncbi:metallophosphoesterase [Thermobifida halotolerans]|uniref:Metallophosphoesterase n=1 Tax=Thermobifida halotolerans TaxID=483545 RepID=A0A399G6B1_9ACTN|nr:metallophosphoesterase [Thermobifida halotolerans]UOE20748.1 metallophosphoesterase [Thermobifida halotolerans]